MERELLHQKAIRQSGARSVMAGLRVRRDTSFSRGMNRMQKPTYLALAIGLSVSFVMLGMAQTPVAPQSSPTASTPAGQQAGIQAGAKIAAELESTVDTRAAKAGDQVVARVTKDVKQNGHKMIRKGDRLIGRINSVQANASGSAGSRLQVTFDRLMQGESTLQLNTVLSSVLSAPARNAEPAPEPISAPSAPPAHSPAGSGGGLLGGVSSTVGAVGSTVGAVGGAVDATARSGVGATGSVLATPVSALRVEPQAQGEHQTSAASLLSTKQDYIRLDAGTRLQFQVTGEAQAAAPAREDNK